PSPISSGVPVQVLSSGDFTAATTLCRPSSGSCDIAEFCTGTSAACPLDTVAPPGTFCRLPIDVCDVAEVCDGTSGQCPGNAVVPFCAVVPAGSGVQVEVDGVIGIGTHYRYGFGNVITGGSFTVSGGSVVPPGLESAYILMWGTDTLSYWQFTTTANATGP